MELQNPPGILTVPGPYFDMFRRSHAYHGLTVAAGFTPWHAAWLEPRNDRLHHVASVYGGLSHLGLCKCAVILHNDNANQWCILSDIL
jgi:hypothetical protein